MPWRTRQGGAAYTPPSGVRIEFDYQIVPEEYTLRGTVFEFSGFNGSYVQQHGASGRRNPLRIYLAGSEHDRAAKVLRAALLEFGVGVLELPFKDPVNVVPLGDMKLVQDHVTRANETAFDVTFYETTGAAFLTRQEDAASAASIALEEFGSASAVSFASSVDLLSVAEQSGFRATFENVLKTVKNTMGDIAAVQENINDEFDDALDLANETIDVLVKAPLDLAFQTQNLVGLPGRSITSISARLDGYSNLSAQLVSTPTATPGGPGGLGPQPGITTGTGNDAQPTNNFHLYELVVGASVAGSIQSTLYTSTTLGTAGLLPGVSLSQADAEDSGTDTGDSSFATAEQAITAAGELLDQLAAYTAWQDVNYTAINGARIIPTNVNTE